MPECYSLQVVEVIHWTDMKVQMASKTLSNQFLFIPTVKMVPQLAKNMKHYSAASHISCGACDN